MDTSDNLCFSDAKVSLSCTNVVIYLYMFRWIMTKRLVKLWPQYQLDFPWPLFEAFIGVSIKFRSLKSII